MVEKPPRSFFPRGWTIYPRRRLQSHRELKNQTEESEEWWDGGSPKREDVEPTGRCRVVNCEVSSAAARVGNEILTRPRVKSIAGVEPPSAQLFANSIETTWFHPRWWSGLEQSLGRVATDSVASPPGKTKATDRSGRRSSCVISHRRRVVARLVKR